MVPPKLDGCVDMSLHGLCCSEKDKMQPDSREKKLLALSVSLRGTRCGGAALSLRT